MARYTDCKGEWFEMWEGDVKCILSIMFQNMADDLRVGYDPLGQSITTQRHEIAEYQKYIDNCYETFKPMTEDQVDHWCFYELKRKGGY